MGTTRTRTPGVRTARWLALVLVLLPMLLPVVARAQVADAVIEVVVVDETNQNLPGVTVTATRPDTGFTKSSVTDETGLTRLLALQPGTYTVRIELQGFTTVEQAGVTLRVGQTARVNATLRVAQVSETVNVVGEAPLVDVYKTDSSTNIVPEQIESLPVQGRDFQSLAFLAPGVQRERGSYRFIQNSPVIGAGGNASQSTILIDGVDATDPLLGLARVRFSQDAISEFRVISNRFDSEIGGSAGGALSVVTKSGTNQLKGSAFGFFRDEALRSKTQVEEDENRDKANFSRQQFGFTIGGPIVKDRTFFFGSYEQVNIDDTALFRPGAPYTARAADIPVPVSQPLLFVGLDHRFTTEQNLRTKFVYERVRQENFRVGGVADESSGFEMQRDNWNFAGQHAWTLSNTSLNQLSFQVGRRGFKEPNNSQALAEYFGSGNTLITGANITGDQDATGDIWEIRDTFFMRVGSGRWAQDLKFGGAWQHVTDDWYFPVYPRDLMIYLSVDRSLPYLYSYYVGPGQSKITTDVLSGFVQTDLRPSSRLTINLGLRYDLDTNGNNPDYTSVLVPEPRGKDTNNFQPRAGFSWDLTGAGAHVVRGGIGLFTGRFLLVPSHTELQQNGITGTFYQRLNGAVLALPPAFWLDPNNPRNTGIALPKVAAGYDDEIVSPHATQFTAGYTVKLGGTGLFADVEGIYVKGDDELILRDLNWPGNSTPACAVSATACRPNTSFNQINFYTNEGHSEYKAFVASLNGTLKGGHVVTASWTVADKKNISDDFSLALTDYPSDPADIEAEFGRSRADERYRFVASAVLRLPMRFTVAPIYSYGSGQPWNRVRGYDYNGDLGRGDRLPGIAKFSEDGPNFSTIDFRVTYRLPLGGRAGVDFIAEVFNLFNRTNWDVSTIQTGEWLSGPTLQNASLPLTPNPNYKKYINTLPPQEAQFGVRVVF